jgi:hypothetical protein
MYEQLRVLKYRTSDGTVFPGQLLIAVLYIGNNQAVHNTYSGNGNNTFSTIYANGMGTRLRAFYNIIHNLNVMLPLRVTLCKML